MKSPVCDTTVQWNTADVGLKCERFVEMGVSTVQTAWTSE